MNDAGERALLDGQPAPRAGAGDRSDADLHASLHALERRQAFLLDLNDQIRELEDPVRIMARAAELLGRYLGAGRVGYGEVGDGQRHVVVERDWTDPLLPSVAGRYRLEDFGPPIIRELKAGVTVVIGDVSTDARTAKPLSLAAFAAIQTRATLTVPLVKGGSLNALLFVHQSTPRNWSPADVAVVEDVAERTWSAVERARVEAALRKSEERLRLSQKAGGVGLWDWDLDSGELFWSDKLYDLLGVPRDEHVTPEMFFSLLHPDDRAGATAAVEAALSGEKALDAEFRFIRPDDGREIWVASRGEVTREDAGRRRLVGVNFDITERRRSEARLRDSAERLQLALRASRMGDWSWDAATDVVTLSERAAEIFGVEPGPRMTWTAMQKLLHPADAARAAQAVEQAVATDGHYDVEYRIRRPADGVEAWIAAQGQPTRNACGSVRGMAGVVQDITERKRAQERQQLLIRELHHRVKNTLATVQAIVGSTARTATSIEEFYEGFVGRIVSLAQTHNLLTEDYWQKASLEEMLRNELGPYEEGDARVTFSGPPVELPSEAAVPVGMAIHELTTNAIKHGALSGRRGRVDVAWEVRPGPDCPSLHFTWTENGGPAVKVPTHHGFGSRLLQRVLTTQLQAKVHMDFDPAGIRFTMDMPLPNSATLLNLLA